MVCKEKTALPISRVTYRRIVFASMCFCTTLISTAQPKKKSKSQRASRPFYGRGELGNVGMPLSDVLGFGLLGKVGIPLAYEMA